MHVPLTEEAMERLREIASLQRRRPQDQAAVIIETALGVRLDHDGNRMSYIDYMQERSKPGGV